MLNFIKLSCDVKITGCKWIILSLFLCTVIGRSWCSSACASSPSAIQNGGVSVNWDGYMLQFHCERGYYLDGASMLVCKDGRWNHPPPICRKGGTSEAESPSVDPKPRSQRYGVLRSLTDTQYQEKYDLPVPQNSPSLPSRLIPKTTRPLFSWKTETDFQTQKSINDGSKQVSHNKMQLGSTKMENQTDASRISGNRMRRKKVKKTTPSLINSHDSQNIDESRSIDINDDKKISAKCTKENYHCRFAEMNYTSINIGDLDMSCQWANNTFLPAPHIKHGVIDVYRRRHNPEEPFNNYLEAFYICRKDYIFENSISHSLYCLRSRWVGQLPRCVLKSSNLLNKTPSNENSPTEGDETEINDDDPEMGFKTSCKINKGGCQQVCEEDRCRCYRGYRLNSDQKRCTDINECEINNSSCQHQCWNIPGSFVCYCPEGYNLGSDKKSCLDKNECLLNNGHGPCQDGCQNNEGGYKCYCNLQGTQLASDNHTCEDIDECASDNFGCAHSCLNTIGSAFCACDEGYMLGEDWKSCEDVDECEFPEIVQSCAGRCINTIGSYKCEAGQNPNDNHKPSIKQEVHHPTPHCDVGYVWNAEQKQCVDVDECVVDNFGCSHFCTNQLGTAACTCPPGTHLLEDWKTCEAVDPCVKGDLKCQYECVNRMGKAECVCPAEYKLLSDGSCKIENECLVNNGGCSQICLTTDAGYQCTCESPQVLAADGKTCKVSYCLSPAEPFRGRVNCDQELEEYRFYPVNTRCRVECQPDTDLVGTHQFHCMENGEWSDTHYKCNEVQLCPKLGDPLHGSVTPQSCVIHSKEEGELCYFQCDEGFILKGPSKRTCGPTLQWDPAETPECVQLIEERVDLKCPTSVNTDLPQNKKQVFVKLSHPISNIDFQYLQVYPSWVRNYQAEFPSGVTLVTIRAVHPITGNGKTCSFQVNVRDRFPPIVYNCPQPITNLVINDNQQDAVIDWEEPHFIDNVGVVSVWKSRERGVRLPPGIHHVRYVARDAAGNTGNCGFSFQIIQVPNVSTRNHPMALQSNEQWAPQNLNHKKIEQSSDCTELQKKHSELIHAFQVAIKNGCIKNPRNLLAAIRKGSVPPTAQLRVSSSNLQS